MKHYILLFFSLICISLRAEDLLLNEIMPSNIDCYFVDHDFPDSWVELYNPTNTTIDLYHYYLGTKADMTKAYRFTTHKTISAKSYLVIPCDKLSNKLHTDFNLNTSEEGQLYLFSSDGTLIDQLVYPEMIIPNVAYGRKTKDSDEWGWEITPTPAKSNTGKLTTAFLPQPVFSREGQIANESFTLKLSLPQEALPEDTKIYYTVDGSEPTTTSTSGKAISLTINQTTTVRAKLISEEAISGRATTHSYIFHKRKTTLPIVSIATEESFLYGDDTGILSSNTTDGQENYKYDWRRPINFEYFANKTSSSAAINQICETAVSGQNSRKYLQKSLKVYAKKRFGKSKLKHKYFWTEKTNVKSVKSLVLRNGGNNADHARINDAFVQKLFGLNCPNLDYQAYSPVIAFINGKYRGLYELRERSNDDYVDSNYPEITDYYMATEASLLSSDTERKNNTFKELYNLYTNNNTKYEHLAALIDIDNFRDALIAEIFATNHDYPHNNISMWRPEGGKWRWILKDLDFFAATSTTLASFDMIKYLTGTAKTTDYEYSFATRTNTKQAAKLYKKMLSMPDFYNNFLDAFSVYLGDFLKPQYSLALLESMQEEIEDEIEDTFSTYNWYSAQFYSKLNRLKTYTKERPRYIYQHLADYYSLGTVIPMSINPLGNEIRMNGNKLQTSYFDGAYFSDRKLRLNSDSYTLGWKMVTYRRDNKNKMVKNPTEFTFEQSAITLELKNYANCDSAVFSLISIDPGTITHTISIGEAGWATLCVPFSFQIPSGINVFTAQNIDVNSQCLLLEPVTTSVANKPYLINGKAGNYTISGNYSASNNPLTNGLLIGTIKDTYAPANTYVLQCKDNTIGFFHVSKDNSIFIPAFHAYLATDNIEKQGPIHIPAEENTIHNIKNDNNISRIRFSLFGLPCDKTSSGFKISQQKDGSFRVEYE